MNYSKLEFKKTYLENANGQILVKNKTLGKLVPMTMNQMLNAVKNGHHQDKITLWFTPESIEEAKKVTKEPKKQKDESEN